MWLLFFIFGFFVDIINKFLIKKVISKFMNNKDKKVLLLSFSIKMFVFLLLFIIIGLVYKNGLIFLFFGFLFARFILSIRKIMRKA